MFTTSRIRFGIVCIACVVGGAIGYWSSANPGEDFVSVASFLAMVLGVAGFSGLVFWSLATTPADATDEKRRLAGERIGKAAALGMIKLNHTLRPFVFWSCVAAGLAKWSGLHETVFWIVTASGGGLGGLISLWIEKNFGSRGNKSPDRTAADSPNDNE